MLKEPSKPQLFHHIHLYENDVVHLFPVHVIPKFFKHIKGVYHKDFQDLCYVEFTLNLN